MIAVYNADKACRELGSWNALTEEVEYNPEKKKSDKVIGYIGYFRLLNGFEKTVYWTKDQIESHRMQFSKMSSGKTPSGVWKSNYDAMAMKTVLKSLLSKWGPMSTDMATAIEHDTDDQPDPIGSPDMEGANEQEFPDDQESGRKEINADEVTGKGNQSPAIKDHAEPKSSADESFADLLSGVDF